MTKEAALYNFFSSFGLPAYPAEDVPDDAVFPWLTYETVSGAYGDELYPLVEVWYYGDSNAEINAKCRQIGERCKNGVMLSCDDGGMLVYSGTWAAVRDPADDRIKRRRSDFSIEFFTRN